MPLDPAHWDHLKRWILTKRSDAPDCPICASGASWSHWEGETIASPVLDTRGGAARLYGRSLWAIAMICTECGYTMHFDHDRIGLSVRYDPSVSPQPDLGDAPDVAQ